MRLGSRSRRVGGRRASVRRVATEVAGTGRRGRRTRAVFLLGDRHTPHGRFALVSLADHVEWVWLVI
jgi:hypothetical protein